MEVVNDAPESWEKKRTHLYRFPWKYAPTDTMLILDFWLSELDTEHFCICTTQGVDLCYSPLENKCNSKQLCAHKFINLKETKQFPKAMNSQKFSQDDRGQDYSRQWGKWGVGGWP